MTAPPLRPPAPATAVAPGAAAASDAGDAARSRRLLAAVAVLGPLAVVVALLTQHVWNMQPCPWCVLQRLEFLTVAAVAAVGALLPAGAPRRVAAVGAAALALAGVATAAWQHFVAAASNSCKLTLADRIMSTLGLDERWPGIFAAWASCADAAVDLLGVPYEAWSALLFAALAVMALAAAASPRRRPAVPASDSAAPSPRG